MTAFLKKAACSYALALVFLAVYETVRVSIYLQEFRFVGPLLVTEPVGSVVILSFVALIMWISFAGLVWYADSDISFSSGLMEVLAMVTVYATCLSSMFFAMSPFMSWVLTVFRGPHQSLFGFYWAAWKRFDGFDALGLIMASAVAGFAVVVTAVLVESWRHPHLARKSVLVPYPDDL